METKTLDGLVKEALLESGLTLHFYLKYLYVMIRELEKLSNQFSFFAKREEATINSYKRVAIPATARKIIDVSIKNGERLQSLFRDESLNKMYYVDGAGKATLEEGDTALEWPESPDFTEGVMQYFDREGMLVSSTPITPWYGLSFGDDRAFTIDWDNNELVFTNAIEDSTVVVITYESSPTSVTAANAVHYMFAETLKTAAHYHHLKFSGAPEYRIERAKREYKNAKRVLKDDLNPFSYADLMYSFRKGLHMGLKN